MNWSMKKNSTGSVVQSFKWKKGLKQRILIREKRKGGIQKNAVEVLEKSSQDETVGFLHDRAQILCNT